MAEIPKNLYGWSFFDFGVAGIGAALADYLGFLTIEEQVPTIFTLLFVAFGVQIVKEETGLLN